MDVPYNIFKIFLIIILLGCRNDKVDLIKEDRSTHTVIIGSSVAAGIGAAQGEGWANLLQKEFVKDKITNLSVPGVTTYYYLPTSFYSYCKANNFPLPDTLKNVDAIVKINPEVVIISITTNDIALGYPTENYMRNMMYITKALEKNEIKFIVTSTLLRDDLTLEKKRKLLELFKQLREVYSEKFVDIFTPNGDTSTLQINPLYFHTDRIHPNNTGHYNIYRKVTSLYKYVR